MACSCCGSDAYLSRSTDLATKSSSRRSSPSMRRRTSSVGVSDRRHDRMDDGCELRNEAIEEGASRTWAAPRTARSRGSPSPGAVAGKRRRSRAAPPPSSTSLGASSGATSNGPVAALSFGPTQDIFTRPVPGLASTSKPTAAPSSARKSNFKESPASTSFVTTERSIRWGRSFTSLLIQPETWGVAISSSGTSRSTRKGPDQCSAGTSSRPYPMPPTAPTRRARYVPPGSSSNVRTIEASCGSCGTSRAWSALKHASRSSFSRASASAMSAASFSSSARVQLARASSPSAASWSAHRAVGESGAPFGASAMAPWMESTNAWSRPVSAPASRRRLAISSRPSWIRPSAWTT